MSTKLNSVGLRAATLVSFTLIAFNALAFNDANFPYEIAVNDSVGSTIVLIQSENAVAIELTNQIDNFVPLSNAYAIGNEKYVPLVLAGGDDVFLYTMARVEGRGLVLGPFYYELFYILGHIKSVKNLSVKYFDPNFTEIKYAQYRVGFTNRLFQTFPKRSMEIGATLPFKLRDYQSPQALEQSVNDIIEVSTAPMMIAGGQEMSAKDKMGLKDQMVKSMQCVLEHTKGKGFSEFTSNMLAQNMLMKQNVSLLGRVMMYLAKSNGSNSSNNSAALKIMHFDTYDSRSVLMELKARKQSIDSLNDDFEEYISSMMSYVQACIKP